MTTYAQKFVAAVRNADERTKRVIAVAGATYIGRFGQGIAVLVTVPLARQNLAPELFGVWMMLSALIGFMAFADLGIGNGVLNNATLSKATGDVKLLERTLLSGYIITGIVGCFLIAVWVLWALLSDQPTVIAGIISPENRREVLKALTVFVILLAINIPASVILRVQLGRQEGYLNGLNQLACAVLTLIFVPLALHHDGDVATLVMATLGAQALVNLINSLAWLYYNGMFSRRKWAGPLHLESIKRLLRTGGMFFLLQLAAAFAFQSDAIVITQTLGQTVYGDFSVVQKLFLLVSTLLNAALVGLWPAFGDAIASKNFAWARTTLFRSAATAAALAALACGILAVAMPWILIKWTHATVNPHWGLISVLSVWTVIDATSGVFASFMNGANILRAQLVFGLGMASAAFGLKWILTPLIGPTGSVLSTILAYSLISIPGQIYIFRQFFKKRG